jgi:hypothetical protein
MQPISLSVNAYFDLPVRAWFARGGSPEPPEAIEVNRPCLARGIRVVRGSPVRLIRVLLVLIRGYSN